MKIALHVPRAAYLEPGVSGDPIFLHALVDGLRERGHEVELVSRVDVRDYWRGRLPARRLLAEAVAVQRRMRRFSPDAWLVYGPSATYPDLFGWWARPKRYVLLATGIGKADRMRRPWRWILPRAHRRSLARADKVAVYRPKSRDSLRALGIEDDRIVVLPLASPGWDFVPAQEDARRRLGLPLDAPVVLSVSRLTAARADGRPWKTEMVLELLAAGASLPEEAMLVHVGDGPGRERIEEEAARLGLNGRLRLAGAVEHRETVWYFAACDFLAFPDLRDFPWLAVLEAQACGRPVVTTRTRSAAMTVDEGRTGLLAADRDEFAAQVAALAGDRDRCRSMGAAAQEYAARTHSMPVRVRQIEELLRGRQGATSLRIAFYSPRASHLEPALAHGGDPIFLEALFGALEERGHEVRVVSRLNVRDVWRGRIPLTRVVREAVRVRREARRFSPDAWLVYNPSRTYPDIFGWWQRPRRYVLLNAHTWQSKRMRRPWRWLLELAFRRSLRRADSVIAGRPATEARLRRLGVKDGRLHVLPPGVRVEPSVPDQADARRRLGLSPAARVTLVVSRFTGDEQASERKTEIVLELLDALRELPDDFMLLIVGDGPGRPRIESAINGLGLAERVRLAGAVAHDELKWYFAACDVYAYPDLLDRPRLSILEAQGSGRPVVALRTESSELTVDAGRTGLLAENLAEFRTQLAELAGDRARSASMGEAAREYVLETHSIGVRASQIEALLGVQTNGTREARDA